MIYFNYFSHRLALTGAWLATAINPIIRWNKTGTTGRPMLYVENPEADG
jgi:hypothetical protein